MVERRVPWARRLMVIEPSALAIFWIEAQVVRLTLAVVGIYDMALIICLAAGGTRPVLSAALTPLWSGAVGSRQVNDCQRSYCGQRTAVPHTRMVGWMKWCTAPSDGGSLHNVFDQYGIIMIYGIYTPHPLPVPYHQVQVHLPPAWYHYSVWYSWHCCAV